MTQSALRHKLQGRLIFHSTHCLKPSLLICVNQCAKEQWILLSAKGCAIFLTLFLQVVKCATCNLSLAMGFQEKLHEKSQNAGQPYIKLGFQF